MKANAKQTVSQSFKQLEPELEAEVENNTLLPATASGLRRVGDVANEVVAEWGARRIDTLAARIAANQVEQLEELALIGHPTCFGGATRSVVETSLRLAARRVLEDALDA